MGSADHSADGGVRVIVRSSGVLSCNPSKIYSFNVAVLTTASVNSVAVMSPRQHCIVASAVIIVKEGEALPPPH